MYLVFGDRLLGDGYKFEDYYSAYGVEAQPRDLRTREGAGVKRDRRTVSDLTGDGGGEETADEGSISISGKKQVIKRKDTEGYI